MYRHRLFATITVFILVIASIIIGPKALYAQSNFIDVPPTTANYIPINQLLTAGIINNSGYFYPEHTISRAELSKLLIGAGKYQNIITTETTNSYYCDVPTYHWAASYISTLTDYEVINGIASNQCSLAKNFFPEQAITKADASKIILSLYGLNLSNDSFNAYNNAIGLGFIANTNPYQLLTRGEASQLIINTMAYYSIHYRELQPKLLHITTTSNTSSYSSYPRHYYSRRSHSSSNNSIPSQNSTTQIIIITTATPSISITPTQTPSSSPSTTPETPSTPSPSVSPTNSSIPSVSPSSGPTPSSSPSPSIFPSPSPTPTSTTVPDSTYHIGTVSVQDYWISPSGNDSNDGSQTAPFASFSHAWSLVPRNSPLTTGFRFHVTAGSYSAPDLYIEDRIGSATAPIIFQSEGSVSINGNFNSRNLHYVYFIGLSYTSPNDVMHFELGDHILLRNMTLRSPSRGAQEGLKVNQSQYFYVEDSDISGAHDNPVDFVAVQYGHVVRSKIHDGEDWCMYAKGGSASLAIEDNEFYDCGTGGFTAGQGTGFEYMTPPWLHYEAYDIRVINNIIHDTEGAGLGVNGGYNILMAHNTLYHVGQRDHVIEVVFGSRSCDGDTAACAHNQSLGGWGPSGTATEVFIGNKHVFIFDNIVDNPTPLASQIFAIYGPRPVSAGGSAPNPAVTDADLRIQGNVIWNGPTDVSLGLGAEQGCLDTHPTCNEAQLRADNAINTTEPDLHNPSSGLYQLMNKADFASLARALPTFSWSDVPTTPPVPTNTTVTNLPYTKDHSNAPASHLYPGAF